MKYFLVAVIKLYQKTISPDTGWLAVVYARRSCRFYPTCSQYTIEAINRFGALKGCQLGVKRISRCHPWNKGGVDEVPKR